MKPLEETQAKPAGKALLVIDVQRDFCEGGALACEGGQELAARISRFLSEKKSEYQVVIGSRDWHTAGSENGGHFPKAGEQPDYRSTWPLHCISGTIGAEYHPNLDSSLIDADVFKGQGAPGYSIFDGITSSGESFEKLLERLAISQVDIIGIATDHCVRASALDARNHGLEVRVLTNLVVGVQGESSQQALSEMNAVGIELVQSD